MLLSTLLQIEIVIDIKSVRLVCIDIKLLCLKFAKNANKTYGIKMI